MTGGPQPDLILAKGGVPVQQMLQICHNIRTPDASRGGGVRLVGPAGFEPAT